MLRIILRKRSIIFMLSTHLTALFKEDAVWRSKFSGIWCWRLEYRHHLFEPPFRNTLLLPSPIHFKIMSCCVTRHTSIVRRILSNVRLTQ